MSLDKALQATLWICLLFVLYTYLLYPVLLFMAYSISQMRRDLQYLVNRRGRRTAELPSEELPAVSLIVAALNEEQRLPGKLANTLELDYPTDRIEAIFVSDGSTDKTNELLTTARDPRISAVILPARRGKANAINEGVARASHSILVFSDASTLFAPDAIRRLVRHFVNPRVGVVCGALSFVGTAESRQTEGVYWKYESMLRLMEARMGATLTASGAIFAVRRECFCPILPNTILDDLIIPMNARKLGYQVCYDPEAVAAEVAAESVAGEFMRRVRIAVGSFRALPQLIRMRLRGFALIAFLSHKLMRWIVPFPLLGALVCSVLLVRHPLYQIMFACEAIFLLWAGIGLAFRRRLEGVPGALVGYFLLAMNAAFLVGFFKVIFRREITWQRTS
jgi:cellulose synthase/poly-beta-1,6-N-acetylglucosamine synthase-like glycosyltransferase